MQRKGITHIDKVTSLVGSNYIHLQKHFSFKVVVVGGGAGGCATAAKFSSKLGAGNVAVIEPADVSENKSYNLLNNQ